jgi:NAD(P)-dependent dehydrogenase (short-subunit alcohol dehydrogenase family)
LVFADGYGLGRALANRLAAAGASIVVISSGTAWRQDGPDKFTLDPTDASQYERLLATMGTGGGAPDRIVHCWGVTGDETVDGATLRRHGFDSLVGLSRAWGRVVHGGEAQLWVVSDGVQSVTGNERLRPAKATVLGPCRVIPREQPYLGCRSVDVAVDRSSMDRVVEQLMREFAVEPTAEAVAYRDAHRWTRVFSQRLLPAVRPGTAIGAVRAGGTYVITGGLGGLGLAVADRVARAGGRSLLIGRTPLPPEDAWGDANASGSPRVRDTIRRLAALRRSGADFMVAVADVADRDAMRAAVRAGEQRWGAIHGAFHAAGVAGGGLIQVKDLASADEIFRSKVDGTEVLHEALAAHELDFVVLFGSNAANIGDVGQVDYSAANCFLDAFAQASNDRRVVAIDWGPWQSIGMSVTTTIPSRLQQVRELDLAARGMTPADGLEALDRVLAWHTGPQIVVSPIALPVLFARAVNLDVTDPIDKLAGLGAPPTVQPRPELAADYVPPRTETEQDLCAIWQGLLGVDRVGVNDNLFDLGGDSLVAIQLAATVNRRWPSAGVTIAQVYETLTVSRMAVKLERPVGLDQSTDQLLADRRDKVQRRRQHLQHLQHRQHRNSRGRSEGNDIG